MRDSSNDPYRARYTPPPDRLLRPPFIETDKTSNSSTFRQVRGVDREIAVVAEAQQGVISLEQLCLLGLDEWEVKYRVQIGRLHQLFRGVYAVGHRELTDRGWFKAAVLSVGEGAALSRESALTLAAVLPGWVEVTEIHVTAPRQTRDQQELRTHHTLLHPRDVTDIEGVPTTTVARALLDGAASLPLGDLRRTLRNAEVDEKVTHEELRWQLARNPGRRGVRKLRPLVEQGPMRVRSALEEKSHGLLRRAGYPEFESNFLLGGMEVDVYLPELSLVIEIDGDGTHDTPTSRFLDAERQARLEALGVTVLRWSERDIHAGRLP